MVDTAEKDAEGLDSDRQLELIEHLTELRTRIIRIAVYVMLGTLAGWIFYDFFFKIISNPILPFLGDGNDFIGTEVTEGFTIKMQISMLIGVILALPLVTMEGWKFVAPGLTKQERKAVKLVGPLSIFLFAGGVIVSYLILPMGFKWLLAQFPTGVKFLPKIGPNLIFILKMLLAFGLTFQLPIILMFLGKVGIVNSKMLIAHWRQAVVVLAIIAAVVTPSGDAFTMGMMCVPLLVLYVLSIGLVKIVERQ
ncbi:MAG TPA: twin-arginine translocase subunit TatC [Armatimonadota bacterium]|nr:twin-arginine translocase subunit TatC [Armatimonadota bacterium]